MSRKCVRIDPAAANDDDSRRGSIVGEPEPRLPEGEGSRSVYDPPGYEDAATRETGDVTAETTGKRACASAGKSCLEISSSFSDLFFFSPL